MRVLTFSPASRQAELRDIYLELSRRLGQHPVKYRPVRPRRQLKNFSCSARRCNALKADPESEKTFKGYGKQLERPLTAGWQAFDDLSDAYEKAIGSKKHATLLGYIGRTRTANKKVKFAELVDPYLRNACQLVFLKNVTEDFEEVIQEGSPIKVQGELRQKQSQGDGSAPPMEEVTVPMFGTVRRDPVYEFVVHKVDYLNRFPDDIIVSSETNVPPEQRHLQIRTSKELRDALRKRSLVLAHCRRVLYSQGFDEIETPILFKSTPEGAREFIVPTREKGMAYALPQSPQQYKQLLISSGIPKYFQFAKCFRDEDMRADRQPEFTQLDFEIAFADRSHVMRMTEKVLDKVWQTVKRSAKREQIYNRGRVAGERLKFEVLTYQTAMSMYGSDKPDLRYRDFPIQQSHQKSLPSTFVSMMTSLENPVIDFIKVNDTLDSASVREFLDSPAASPHHSNPAGPPAVLTVDTSKPLSGLSALGHDFAPQFMEDTQAEPGDTFIFQARPDLPFHDGSTALGDIRRDLIKFGLSKSLLCPVKDDSFAWIVDFPLFKPTTNSSPDDPGQGGHASIQSTHHPFTAPKSSADLDHLLSGNPLLAVGDHYDLVINGIEVGGGSKRIHLSAVQEHIFRHILKISPERVEDFRHLLEALRAGCPPHAGIALGFDRLMAIICDKESVRDVIAFPKWGSGGEDKLVKAPAKMTEEQLGTYHLKLRE